MTLKGTHIPQAYTAKDVTEAFMWLQSQPDGIRSRVKNTEELMWVYFRYKRTGGGSPFLESFASNGSLGQQVDLSTDENQAKHPNTATSEAKFLSTLKNLQSEIQQFTQPESEKPTARPDGRESTEASPSATGAAAGSAQLDPRSREIIQFIRSALNLSSDQEVIRMCLILGYEKLRQILPPQV